MYTVNKSFNESMEELGMEMDPLFQEEAFYKADGSASDELGGLGV